MASMSKAGRLKSIVLMSYRGGGGIGRQSQDPRDILKSNKSRRAFRLDGPVRGLPAGDRSGLLSGADPDYLTNLRQIGQDAVGTQCRIVDFGGTGRQAGGVAGVAGGAHPELLGRRQLGLQAR